MFFFRFFSLMGYHKIFKYSSLCYTGGPCCLSVFLFLNSKNIYFLRGRSIQQMPTDVRARNPNKSPM